MFKTSASSSTPAQAFCGPTKQTFEPPVQTFLSRCSVHRHFVSVIDPLLVRLPLFLLAQLLICLPLRILFLFAGASSLTTLLL